MTSGGRCSTRRRGRLSSRCVCVTSNAASSAYSPATCPPRTPRWTDMRPRSHAWLSCAIAQNQVADLAGGRDAAEVHEELLSTRKKLEEREHSLLVRARDARPARAHMRAQPETRAWPSVRLCSAAGGGSPGQGLRAAGARAEGAPRQGSRLACIQRRARERGRRGPAPPRSRAGGGHRARGGDTRRVGKAAAGDRRSRVHGGVPDGCAGGRGCRVRPALRVRVRPTATSLIFGLRHGLLARTDLT